MNFFKYTFTARFSIIIVMVFTAGWLMAGVMHWMHKPLGEHIIFYSCITFLLTSVIYRLFSWRRYRRTIIDNELRMLHKHWNDEPDK